MRTGPLVPFSFSLVSLSAGGSSLCAVLCRLHWGKSLKRIKKETGREGKQTAAQQPQTVTILDKSMTGCSCSNPGATLAWQQGTAALQWFTGSGGGGPGSISAGDMGCGGHSDRQKYVYGIKLIVQRLTCPCAALSNGPISQLLEKEASASVRCPSPGAVLLLPLALRRSQPLSVVSCCSSQSTKW